MAKPVVKRSAKAAGKRRTVVHLGNVDGAPHAEKTKRYAKMFPKTEFVGIDLIGLRGRRQTNFRQIKADFVSGLKKLRNNSVSIISSELAFGLYPKPGAYPSNTQKAKYTAEALTQVHAKLVPGGKLLVSIDEYNLQPLKAALKRSPFKATNIEIREFKKHEYERSFYSREFKDYPILYQVTVTK